MIYEVRATMFFDKEDEATDFAHDCQMALPKTILVNPNTLAQEVSSWQLLHCNHDQNPNEPCELIDHDDNLPLEPED